MLVLSLLCVCVFVHTYHKIWHGSLLFPGQGRPWSSFSSLLFHWLCASHYSGRCHPHYTSTSQDTCSWRRQWVASPCWSPPLTIFDSQGSTRELLYSPVASCSGSLSSRLRRACSWRHSRTMQYHNNKNSRTYYVHTKASPWLEALHVASEGMSCPMHDRRNESDWWYIHTFEY